MIKPDVFFLGKEITEIKAKDLADLKEAATRSSLKRARFCMHKDHNDTMHEMIIAFRKGSYIRPHRHKEKIESFHIIEGELLVIFFDDNGNPTHRIKMSPYNSGETFFYRLSVCAWHMVIPISEYVILHEITNGPFVEGETEFSTWSPNESDSNEVTDFLSKVLNEKIS